MGRKSNLCWVLGFCLFAAVTAANTAHTQDNPLVAPREVVKHFFVAESTNASADVTVIGRSQAYVVTKGDTFLDLARRFSLGYNELVAANATADPWAAEEGLNLLLPTEWILPRGPRSGLVVNIPEMRLYYYLPPTSDDGTLPAVVSYPVGLGRQEWRTPVGEFRVRGKTFNPTWVLPESVREERIREKGHAERSIPGGHPDNPLGRHRLELTLGAYAIHGTNKNWGIGMQVSHGCVRMYPEDIAALFALVPPGTVGRFDYQPLKVGRRAGRVFIEVHEDVYGMSPWLWELAQQVVGEAGLADFVDPAKLEAAVEAATGVPTDVSFTDWPSPVRRIAEDMVSASRRQVTPVRSPDRTDGAF